MITVKQDSTPTVAATNHSATSSHPTYDPTVAYILEFCTILTLKNDELIHSMGRPVFSVVLGLLRDPMKWHPITLSRATFHAFSILKKSYVSPTRRLVHHFLANSKRRISISSKCILCFTLLQIYHNTLLTKLPMSSRAVLLFAQTSQVHCEMK